MNHPDLMSSNSEARYQQMLQKAEAERRYRKIKGNGPNLLERTGEFLISAGRKLKTEAQSNVVVPASQTE